MPLDGLRAWIGELERKLGARTRVGLVLVAIAVGGAGAGIYLSLDTADESASKSELRQLQTQVDQFGGTSPQSGLEARLASVEATAKAAQAEVAKLQAQVRTLQGHSTGGSSNGAKGGTTK
jgi:uncharacterized protein HemX